MQEDAMNNMNKLVFAIALFLIVPALRAQQAETSGTSTQGATQPAPHPVPQSAVLVFTVA
jgi:hypothetical protein